MHPAPAPLVLADEDRVGQAAAELIANRLRARPRSERRPALASMALPAGPVAHIRSPHGPRPGRRPDGIRDDGRRLRDMHVPGSPVTTGPVIVGVDGAAGARDAVALGHFLAELLHAPLDVVTGSGSTPVPMLADVARAEDAAVIVLGPAHRRALTRAVRGTARQLLPGTPCPIAVAPAGFADRRHQPVRRIGVGYEPTRQGHDALAAAHRLASGVGAELRAIGVALPLAPLAVDDLRDRTPYLDDERRAVRAGLERALAELPPGVRTVADARVGDPAAELAAASEKLDLLVCGSRARSPVRVLLLGSVTERLLHDAACPLLIVARRGPELL